MNDQELIEAWYKVETTEYDEFDLKACRKAVNLLYKHSKYEGRPKITVFDSPYQVLAYVNIRQAMGERVIPAHAFTKVFGKGFTGITNSGDLRLTAMSPIARLLFRQYNARGGRNSRSFNPPPTEVKRMKELGREHLAKEMARKRSLAALLPKFKRIPDSAKLHLFYKSLQCPSPNSDGTERFKALVFIASVEDRTKNLDVVLEFIRHTSDIKFITGNECVIAKRPTKRYDNMEEWADGITANRASTELWTDIKHIRKPHEVDLETFVGLNQELQAAVMHITTGEQLIKQFQLVEEQTDEFGTLFRFPDWSHKDPIANRNLIKLVKVKNGSPEPDGTYKNYFLKVPSTIATAHEAVAWSYSKQPEDYKPSVRT